MQTVPLVNEPESVSDEYAEAGGGHVTRWGMMLNH